MAKKLVIVESPAKAKTINKYLGAEYQVEASMGHVRDLPNSRFGVDIAQDFEPTYAVIAKAKKVVTKLKKAAKDKEVIYLAPDPDREGEAISWHLQEIMKEVNENIYRVTFNEITRGAIQEAFKKPRSIDMHLVDAQQARRILDRIVGYKVSPLLWKKVAQGLSAGRVQTVALRLIIEREAEVKAFVPKEYWIIKAYLSSEKDTAVELVAKLEKIKGEKTEIPSAEACERILAEIETQQFVVKSIEEKEKKRKPQAPYTTSKLQQEAYTRLRFSAQKTMRIAQGLYEGKEIGSEGSVGLITYMRTDSVNVSKTAQQEARDFIVEKYGKEYLPKTPAVYKSKKQAQEAHEAIRPSDPTREPEQIKQYLDADEFKLYDLIWRKFIASQMVPAIDNVTSIDIAAGETYLFRASGSRTVFKGFLACYGGENATADDDKNGDAPENGKENTNMPHLTEGETLKKNDIKHTQHFTKPPPRFNDASLVKTLEELGIGRPSTYAPTIQTLIARSYVDRRSGVLYPTDMGMVVAQLLVENFTKIFDYKFTALMEEDLDKIEEGSMGWVAVLKEFYTPFKEQLETAEEKMKNVKREAVVTDHVCEKCGKAMVEKWGRFGKFLACSGFPNCRNTAPMPTGIACPQEGCTGFLVKRQSRNRRTFYGCSNYPQCTYVTNRLPKANKETETEQNSAE